MKFVNSITAAALFLFMILGSCHKATDRQAIALADTLQIKLLLDSGAAYLWKTGSEKSDMSNAYSYFTRAEKLSMVLKSRIWQNIARSYLGDYYYENEEDSLGKVYFMKVIKDYQDTNELSLEAAAWLRFGATKSWDPRLTEQNLASSQKAVELFKADGNIKEAATALKQVADIHYQLRNIPLAEHELLEVIRMYTSVHYKNLHYTYDLLSGISIINGRYNKALFYAQEMIKSMYATQDTISAGSFYMRLADINYRLGNFHESIRWWLKSYNLYNDQHIVRYDIARSTVIAMIGAGQAKRGLDFINQLIKARPPGNIDDKRHIYLALGMCYQALKNYPNAELYFSKAIIEDDRMAYKDGMSSTINFYTGKFYVAVKQYDKASGFLYKVMGLVKQYPILSRIMDTEYLLFKIDSASLRPYKAISHFQVYNALKDSIFNETKSKQIEELQIQYEINQKEQNIQLLKNRTALQQINLNITYAGILLLLILLAILFKFYRIKNKGNQDLKEKQILINQKNSSLKQLVKEKEWLLKEVHHRVKNNLQIVQSLLSSQAAYLNDKEALLAIQNSKNRVQAISLIHQKLYYSDHMSRINMNVYIQELCLHLRDSYEISNRIVFELDIDDIELGVSQAVPVGLIVNEAITNSIKYAFRDLDKGLIRISLHQNNHRAIVLKISDNGIGLPVDFDQIRNGAFGIKLMTGLSEDLEGLLTIKQQGGTVITMLFDASFSQPDPSFVNDSIRVA